MTSRSDTLDAITRFGLACLEESRIDGGSDIDGGWLQDTAEKFGLLVRLSVTEPCHETCYCADAGDFPQDCLRYSPGVQSLIETI